MRLTPEGSSDACREGLASPRRERSYVLVVDDDSAVREFLKRRLEEWGYAVQQVGTALDALETMAIRPAAVVLCDIKMPTHDGLWLTEQLRAQWPDTPVVMTTALDDVDTITKSRELGAVDYLTKPIDPAQLHRAVQRATSANEEGSFEPPDSTAASTDDLHTQFGAIEAEYSLECPVRCPTCGEIVTRVKAVRLLRAHVNFTSTLPRRGRLVACPHCFAVIPAELSNF